MFKHGAVIPGRGGPGAHAPAPNRTPRGGSSAQKGSPGMGCDTGVSFCGRFPGLMAVEPVEIWGLSSPPRGWCRCRSGERGVALKSFCGVKNRTWWRSGSLVCISLIMLIAYLPLCKWCKEQRLLHLGTLWLRGAPTPLGKSLKHQRSRTPTLLLPRTATPSVGSC